MVSAKTRGINRLAKSGNLMLVLFLAGAAVIQWFRPVDSCALCLINQDRTQDAQAEADLELVRARERFELSDQHYKSIKRLSEKGSVSDRQRRRAELKRNLALFEYHSLLDPGQQERNRLRAAEAVFQFQRQERAVMESLFARGSISESAFRRSIAAQDVAMANLKAVQSDSLARQKLEAIKAAEAKRKIASREYETAKRLFQSRAISRETLSQAESQLTIANAELNSAKQRLGARAIQIRQ